MQFDLAATLAAAHADRAAHTQQWIVSGPAMGTRCRGFGAADVARAVADRLDREHDTVGAHHVAGPAGPEVR